MNDEKPADTVRRFTGWEMFWSILMFACGVLAIFQPFAASLGTTIFLGWLVLFFGVANLVFAFQSHSVGGFLWKILLAILYGLAGIYLLMNPLRGSGWLLFDGIISILLGILIWRQWPGSSLWIIGLLVGLNFIFAGISRFVIAAGVRQVATAIGSAGL
jgi:uncharacterized membrane protein HdeD (DUF308 family)